MNSSPAKGITETKTTYCSCKPCPGEKFFGRQIHLGLHSREQCILGAESGFRLNEQRYDNWDGSQHVLVDGIGVKIQTPVVYHLLSNYIVADTVLNNFKYIISVTLHDNPNSGYFHPSLQKKLKLTEQISG